MNIILKAISWWYRIVGVLIGLAGVIQAVRLYLDMPNAGLEGMVLWIAVIVVFIFAMSVAVGIFHIGNEAKRYVFGAMWKSLVLDIFGMIVIMVILSPLFEVHPYIAYSIFAIIGINLLCSVGLIFNGDTSQEN